MGEETSISWCHHSFNIVIGCTKVSEACQFCYAEAMSKRMGLKVWGADADRKILSESYWKQPLKWNRMAEVLGERKRVFCSSMADVFEDHPTLESQRQRLFSLVEQTPWLDWLLLTKRPENIRSMMPDEWRYHPRRNVWLGTTIENQKNLEPRADALLSTPARVHFFSCEPLLSEINLRGYRPAWVIAGGESGGHYRALNIDHVRSLRDQCADKGSAFYFKQVGGRFPNSNGCLLDGVEYKEFPKAA